MDADEAAREEPDWTVMSPDEVVIHELAGQKERLEAELQHERRRAEALAAAVERHLDGYRRNYPSDLISAITAYRYRGGEG